MKMKVDNLLKVISGILFIVSGIALMLNIKVFDALNIKLLLGLFLVVTGISIALGASLGSSAALALAVAVLLISLSKVPFHVKIVENHGLRFTLKYGECESFRVISQMSGINLTTGANTSFAHGITALRELEEGSCGLKVCCGHANIALSDPENLSVKSALSSSKLNINNCVKEMKVSNYMGSVRLTYNVPPRCSGYLKVESDLGSTTIILNVPKNVKVLYSFSTELGSIDVELPTGKSSKEGRFGEGSYLLRVEGETSMGSIRLMINEMK